MRGKQLVLLVATTCAVVTVGNSVSEACIRLAPSGFLASSNTAGASSYTVLPKNAKGLVYIDSKVISPRDFEIRVSQGSSWVKVAAVVQRHDVLQRSPSEQHLFYERKSASEPLQVEFYRIVLAQHHTIVSVAPKGGFVAGKQFRIRTNSEERFVRISSAEIDLAKAEVAVKSHTQTAQFKQPIGCGHTATFRAALAKLSIKLPTRLARYKEHFLFETYIDGELWEVPQGWENLIFPGRSLYPAGEEIVYLACPHRGSAIAPGVHSVSMRAYFLADTGLQIVESAPIRVRLACS